MKRFVSLFLAFSFACVSLVSCGGDGDTGDNKITTAAGDASTTVAETTTAVTTEEPERFVSSEIFKEMVTEYVIVYDDSTREMRQWVRDFNDGIKVAFGTRFEAKAYDEKPDDGSPEIVLGNVRDIADKTYKKLTGMYDFALKVEENKLVLCAKNTLSYEYMLNYLLREVFVKNDKGDLVLDSGDNMIYSDSDLNKTSYVKYMLDAGKSFEMQEIFEKREYKKGATTLPYRIYVPFNYDPEKSYPVFINLHGSGHRGNDNEKHLGFITSLMKEKNLPLNESIIIFPQCPENNKWVDSDWGKGSYSLDSVPESNELKALMDIITQIKQEFSVDEKRVYACGLSMGGYGVWNLLMNHPDVFAAGIAMCGAGDPAKAGTLVDIPVWAIHGAKDPTVPVSGSREMVNAIKAAGGTKVKYTELPNNEHDVWTYTYSNLEIFTWLFNQKKA